MTRESAYMQRTLAGGIISPLLFARGDTTKAATGARDLLNVMVLRSGSAANRPGTQFIAEVKTSAKATRFIPWIFDDDDRFAIEVGDDYMRFHQDGARIVVSGPAAHSTTAFYDPGDIVRVGAVGAYAHYYCIAANTNTVPPNASFWYALTMTDLDDTPTVGGISILEVPSPYQDTQLFDVRFVQSNDVMWLVHPSYPIHELTRFTNTKWTMRPFNPKPPIDGPLKLTSTSVGANKTDRYKVTSVKKGKQEESLPGCITHVVTGTLSGGSGVNITVTSVAHGIIFGVSIVPIDVFPTTGNVNAAFEAALENKATTASNITDNTFALPNTAGLTVPAGYSISVIIAGTGNIIGFTSGTVATDGVITSAGHGLTTGDGLLVLFATFGTTTAAFAAVVGKTFTVTVQSATVFTLDDSDGLDWDNDVALVYLSPTQLTDTHNVGEDVTLTWNAVPDAEAYYVYKELNGVYGFIGTAVGTTFVDKAAALAPDTTDTPPAFINPFRKANSYPAAAGLHKERLIFAGTNDDPGKFWMSRVGDFRNFTIRSPLQEDDSVEATVSGAQMLRHLLDMDTLVALSTSGIFFVYGDADGAIRPTAINIKKRGRIGAAAVSPLEIDDSALFVEARGGTVRDFRIDALEFQKGRDLTVYAPHLFDGFKIADWAYQRQPHSAAWAVRDDGVLLGMTYVREQEIAGWHRHVTGSGIDFGFESIAVIPDGKEDRVYAIVRRTVNGATVRYAEFFTARKAGDPAYVLATDAKFLDSMLTYNGTNTTAVQLKLDNNGPTEWLLTSNLGGVDAPFTNTPAGVEIGRRYKLVIGGQTAIVEVIAFNTVTVLRTVLISPATLPAAMQGVFTPTWTRMVKIVTGLTHLEGRTVGVLGDGNVLPQAIVASGQITLGQPYGIIHAGLPYNADIETLDIDSPNSAIAGRQKRVPQVMALMDGTVVSAGFGPRVGPTAATLVPFIETPVAATTDTHLFSGKAVARPNAEFNNKGSLLIRQAYPLPMLVEGFLLMAEVET